MTDHFISSEQAENDLLACAAFLGERINGNDGHAEATIAIIPHYLTKGNIDLAAELANAVADPFSRDRMLTDVAEKCAEIDDADYALQLADAIEDLGIASQARERIGLALAARGNVEKANEVADSMSHPDFVYSGIAVRQAADGDIAAAERSLEKIEFPTAKVSGLQQMASGKIVKGEMGSAVQTLDLAAAGAGEIEHNEERIRTYCEIGNLYIEARRYDKAIEIFERARSLAEVLDNFHRETFLTTCALGFLHARNIGEAETTLDTISDRTQVASTLLGFARWHWKEGEKEEANEALDEAYEVLRSQPEKEIRDSRTRNGLIAAIAGQFAGFGRSDRGCEAALEIQDMNEQMSALGQIASTMTLQGDNDRARQALNLIAQDANRLLALVGMSDARSSDKDSALPLLDEASSLAETVPQMGARSNVYNEIAARYINYGEAEKAREISIENLTVISAIRDESSQAASLANLSEVYETGGLTIDDREKEILRRLVQKAVL